MHSCVSQLGKGTRDDVLKPGDKFGIVRIPDIRPLCQ